MTALTPDEEATLRHVRALSGRDGPARWHRIIEECKKEGIDLDRTEEALNSLLDKAIIYEPVLGQIRVV